MAVVTQKFADAVAKGIGVDNSGGWFTGFLNEWARWEGANSAFNPLATTQSMPGAGDFNSAGVKNYTSFNQGVDATVKTMTNRYYPKLMKALRTRDFSDMQGITSNIRTWGTTGFANALSSGSYSPGDSSDPVMGRAATVPATGGPEMGISPRLEPGEGGVGDPSGNLIPEVTGDNWSELGTFLEERAGDFRANAPIFADFSDDDFGTAAENYAQANAAWMQNINDTLTTAQNLKLMGEGFTQLPDGTVIPTSTMQPEEFQALVDSNTNAYNTLLNQYSVGQYNLDSGYENQQWRGQLDEIDAKNSLDQTGIDATQQAINRVLNGQAESRGRASYVTDTLSANAGMMTGPAGQGKTSFSAGDFGGLGSYVSELMGLDPGSPFLNLTGSVTIDPAGQLDKYDEQLGVGGKVPDAYIPSQTPGDVPSPPQWSPPPSLVPPVNTGANVVNPPPGGATPGATTPTGAEDPYAAILDASKNRDQRATDKLNPWPGQVVIPGTFGDQGGDQGGNWYDFLNPKNFDPRNIPFSWSPPSNYLP